VEYLDQQVLERNKDKARAEEQNLVPELLARDLKRKKEVKENDTNN
jgi:hypothetical protein